MKTDIYKDVLNKINSLNFDSVTSKLVKKYKWKKQDAKECEKLYKNFLYLNFKYGKDICLVPTEEIDIFWHEHILDTERYMKDCNSVFGKYLHHEQSDLDSASSSNKVNDFFEQTQEAHKKEFGYYMYDIRISFKSLVKGILNKFKKRSN